MDFPLVDSQRGRLGIACLRVRSSRWTGGRPFQRGDAVIDQDCGVVDPVFSILDGLYGFKGGMIEFKCRVVGRFDYAQAKLWKEGSGEPDGQTEPLPQSFRSQVGFKDHRHT